MNVENDKVNGKNIGLQGLRLETPLALSKTERIALVDHVADTLDVAECDHSFRFTEGYLAMNGLNVAAVILWLRQRDITCDCDLLGDLEFL